MASVVKRGEKYQCLIRRKGKTMSAHFSDYETALLWGKYKENLIDEIVFFNTPANEIILLGDALDLKLQEIIKEEKERKDFITIRKTFEEFLDRPVSELTYDVLFNKFNDMRNSTVIRGGNRDNQTGVVVIQAMATILRKFRVLSSVINHLVSLGINVDNNAIKITNYITTKMKDKS